MDSPTDLVEHIPPDDCPTCTCKVRQHWYPGAPPDPDGVHHEPEPCPDCDCGSGACLYCGHIHPDDEACGECACKGADRDFATRIPWIDKDPWERHYLGVDAMAGRFLRYWADRLLCVEADGGRWSVRMLRPGGTWSRDDGGVAAYIDRVVQAWVADAMANAGEARAAIVRKALTYTNKRGQADLLYQVGAVVNRYRDEKVWPYGLTACHTNELDPTGRYIGAPNGIIDLDTGYLIDDDEAGDHLITRQVGVDYDIRYGFSESRSPLADKLFARLGEQERQWFLEALGFALRGRPMRRIYVLIGPPAGGKSTIVNVLMRVLGDYAGELGMGAVAAKAVQEARGLTPEAATLAEKRIVTISEPSAPLSAAVLKRTSGGDAVKRRRLYQDEEESLATATLFIVGNDGHLGRLPLEDAALMDRVRVLRMDAIPDGERDPDLEAQIMADPDALKSVLAMIVRAAEFRREPPADVPHVAEERLSLQKAMIGPAGEWMLTALVEDPAGVVTTDALWNAARRAAGGDGDPWGATRRQLTALARDLHSLRSATLMSIGGRKVRAWRGYRLATDAEAAAAVQEAMEIVTPTRREFVEGMPDRLDMDETERDVIERIIERHGGHLRPQGEHGTRSFHIDGDDAEELAARYSRLADDPDHPEVQLLNMREKCDRCDYDDDFGVGVAPSSKRLAADAERDGGLVFCERHAGRCISCDRELLSSPRDGRCWECAS